ncbi:MAG: hypothetical protein AAGI15_00595 [Pseudomonadota bacterium]
MNSPLAIDYGLEDFEAPEIPEGYLAVNNLVLFEQYEPQNSGADVTDDDDAMYTNLYLIPC